MLGEGDTTRTNTNQGDIVTPQRPEISPNRTPNQDRVYATPRRRFVGLDEFNGNIIDSQWFMCMIICRIFHFNSLIAFKEMCASNFAAIKASQQNISGMLVTVLDSMERMEKPRKKEQQTRDFGVNFPIRTLEEFGRVQSLLESDHLFYRHLVMFIFYCSSFK